VALLLLRGSILSSFLIIATSRLNLPSMPFALAGVVLVCLCLAGGFMTPVMSVTAAAVAIADVLAGPQAHAFGPDCVLVLDAAALGLLGPGAYSVDARLFGRRVTVLPPPTDAAGD
jgi:hypothetical protein